MLNHTTLEYEKPNKNREKEIKKMELYVRVTENCAI